MILLIGSQKGGVGKSTVAINLAVEYARQGRDVCLVDADAQRSAARWHADREEQGHQPAVACVEKFGTIHQTLTDLATRYDIVIVDVAGKDSREMRTGMLAADTLVVVVRPSQLDLDTLGHMSEVIEQAKDLNPGLTVRGLIAQAPSNPAISERTDAREYLADYPTIKPLETVLYERKAYRDVVGEGLGVVEWSNPKAKAEIQELAAEVQA
ncbi:AAA family ATPase [uncultured Citricoccus sp.]|uniref:AAA family ATPase n=1 Tax=uncultured Citricoccus sp. TaxID=614031 RepID=UPI002605314A|nr:AAA family ATPase [uncultured Citricoccus sp.]